MRASSPLKRPADTTGRNRQNCNTFYPVTWGVSSAADMGEKSLVATAEDRLWVNVFAVAPLVGH